MGRAVPVGANRVPLGTRPGGWSTALLGEQGVVQRVFDEVIHGAPVGARFVRQCSPHKGQLLAQRVRREEAEEREFVTGRHGGIFWGEWQARRARLHPLIMQWNVESGREFSVGRSTAACLVPVDARLTQPSRSTPFGVRLVSRPVLGGAAGRLISQRVTAGTHVRGPAAGPAHHTVPTALVLRTAP